MQDFDDILLEKINEFSTVSDEMSGKMPPDKKSHPENWPPENCPLEKCPENLFY